MLAKKYKIPTRYRIQRVFEKGRRISGPNLSLWYYPCQKMVPRFAGQVSLALARPHSLRSCVFFAVITPVKLKIKPVIRNRIRRRIYEIIRLVAKKGGGDYASSGGYDIAVVVRNSEIAHSPFDRLQAEFQHLYQRLHP